MLKQQTEICEKYGRKYAGNTGGNLWGIQREMCRKYRGKCVGNTEGNVWEI